MEDIFGKLYNGFLLRDLLGYVVPGSFVLLCLAHLFSTFSGIGVKQLAGVATDNVFTYVLIFGFCYACGHFLSGLFFHSPIFKRIFTYASSDLLNDYPNLSRDKAWIAHRITYRKVCNSLGDPMKEQIERHAALVHFSGHFSAGILFAIAYVIFLSLYHRNLQFLLYGLPLLILFPGIFIHYRRLLFERYSFERSAILSAPIDEGTDKVTGEMVGPIAIPCPPTSS